MNLIARRAAIISLSRIANQGLMLFSPIVLVRVLSIEEFGAYREFVLHASVLSECLAFAVSSSLLYFVPAYSAATWKLVRQCVLIVLTISTVGLLAVLAVDHALNARVLGTYGPYIAAYVFCYVNFDFWEHLWLAQRKTTAVLAYSSGRVMLRILLVVVVATRTSNVTVIVQMLVAFEAARALISLLSWRLCVDRASEVYAGISLWREQLRFCIPFGSALVLTSLNSNLSALLVDHVLGHVSLAYFSVAMYSYLIVNALRNSLSDVLLPEMVRSAERGGDSLVLWRRSVVVFAILLLPVGTILCRYASTVLPLLFSKGFAAAVPVFQIYLLTFVRECFDLDLLFRAINQPRVLLHAQILSFLSSLLLLALLVPIFGVPGAALSVVAARFIHAAFLLFRLRRITRRSFAQLIPVAGFLRVVAATLSASVIIMPGTWTDTFGPAGLVLSSCAYLLCVMFMLRALGVEEASYVLGLATRKMLSRPA